MVRSGPNGTHRQDLRKIGKRVSGMRAEPFASRDGRLQVKEMTLTSRAALGDAMAQRERSIPVARAVDESEFCLRRSERTGVVDFTLVSIFSRAPCTNVESKTAPESYSFQWFFGFLICN